MIRRAALGGLVLVLVWLASIAGLLVLRHDLIYPFRDWPQADTPSGLPGAQVVRVDARDGTLLVLWQVAPRQGRPVILYFMGNAGSLPSAGPRLSELVLQGYGVVAMNYRGAGGAEGAPSQTALIADALDVYDRFGGPETVIYGTSLGAAVATQLAARRPAAALILETPFARLCETAAFHYPIIPVCAVLRDEHWDSAAAISRHKGPLLVLHGDADQVIPISHGRALFAAANEPKTFVTYAGGRHNDLRLYGAGAEIVRFLTALPEGGTVKPQ